jgi:hypothetical protein
MKRLLECIVIISLLAGCRTPDIKKENLIGQWECVSLNNGDFREKGFTSVKMQIFSNDSLEVSNNDYEDLWRYNNQSKGGWSIENRIFKSKLGEDSTKSEITFSGDNIIFKPDPLFNPKMITSSEYRRVR